MITVVCVKVGTKYGPEYVNTLQSMVARHLTIPHRFLCITDDPEGLECETVEPEEESEGWWTKLTLFRKDPYGIEGKLLFFDLDVVIVDDIDPLATFDSDFAIIDDWHVPTYNSSVILLRAGSQTQVWDNYIADPIKARRFAPGGDQHHITLHAKADLWPKGWCMSYRTHCQSAPTGKIVVFHGNPNPHMCGGWVEGLWR